MWKSLLSPCSPQRPLCPAPHLPPPLCNLLGFGGNADRRAALDSVSKETFGSINAWAPSPIRCPFSAECPAPSRALLTR